MDIALYRVIGAQNRVALGELAADTEFFTATIADEGVITLTPVRVIDASTKRTTPAPAPVPANDEQPWDDDPDE